MAAFSFTPTSMRTKDGRTLAVRALAPGDAAALQRFNAELSDRSRWLFLPHAYDDDTVFRALARAQAGEDLLLGLFDADRLVGYFFLWYFTDPVPLLGIGLLDAYHRQGLGRQMMATLIAAAKAAGKAGIELTTRQENAPAFALYQQVGFVHYGDVDNIDGAGNHVVERGMFLALTPGGQRMDRPHQPPI